MNLVSNACKVTTVGEIVTRYFCRVDESGNERLRLEVADTGPGVPDENKELIFQPFVQVGDRARS